MTRADLALSTEDSPDPVHTGAILDYLLDVGNKGPSDAQTVVVHVPIPEPEQDTTDTEAEAEAEESRPRRKARPAGEHVEQAQSRLISPDGLGGLSAPTLAEAIAEQEEAIQQFRTLWWRIPRGIYAVTYVVAFVVIVMALRTLRRIRYSVTAVVLGGGLYLLWQAWGVGA